MTFIIYIITLIRFKFPIIGLTEHKIGKNLPVSNVNIPGYNFCFDPTKSSHAGTGFSSQKNLHLKDVMMLKSSLILP